MKIGKPVTLLTLISTVAVSAQNFHSVIKDNISTAKLKADAYNGDMPESSVKPPTHSQRWVVPVNGGILAFVPYGPNIIHVTLITDENDRVVPSGWGIIASPYGESDWNFKNKSNSATLKSSSITLNIDNQSGGFVAVRSDGRPICQFLGGQISTNTVSVVEANHVVGTFTAGDDEHYFGLGQHQDGQLDLRNKKFSVWHHYSIKQTIGFPFLISTRNYAIIWDNPARTELDCAINGKTKWSSEVGNAISFFIIVGKTSDEVYAGYRSLTGETPLPPKAALGLIQSKARYASQTELLDVANGYRQRHYPCDILVVDWFHWNKLGDLALDPKQWPDPKGMNEQLQKLGFRTMITVWPGFSKESKHYDEVVTNKLALMNGDGAPGHLSRDPFHRDAEIDSTNPKARVWYWDQIAAGYRADGFDYYWLDETEPDVEWHNEFCFLGPCAQVYNIYPLAHTAGLYQGQRNVSDERVLLLARDAYLGAQRNGATFWSSDIEAKWQALQNQIPTGLNMCASGLPYWSSDTGGWQDLPKESHPATLLLDPSDARGVIGNNDDYPELFVRWFEFSTFCPTLRAHGSRKQNEVWSFGKAAEPILAKYLKLRYQLLPYIYSQAHFSEKTGAPFMRALFMDFPSDAKAITLSNEYMFGPAFLVAPVTSQATTNRSVYLPVGTDWYDFWTNQRYHGGQVITAKAPIDVLPLYVRAGSIIPLGTEIESTQTSQSISEIRVYQGADADFSLYDDDGHTYQYESGQFTIRHLLYNNRTKKFSMSGTGASIAQGLQPTFINGSAL